MGHLHTILCKPQISTDFSAILCYTKEKGCEIMEEVEKLEQMILNNESYEKIIEQSKRIDEYVNKKIGEAV